MKKQVSAEFKEALSDELSRLKAPGRVSEQRPLNYLRAVESALSQAERSANQFEEEMIDEGWGTGGGPDLADQLLGAIGSAQSVVRKARAAVNKGLQKK